MDQALICAICIESYDLSDKRPKALKCGHSICLLCLKEWAKKQGRVECPTCNEISYTQVEEIPDNQAIKDILTTREVRCPRHIEVIVTDFCMTHISVKCGKCSHQMEGCVFKDIMENVMEIQNSVLSKIGDLYQRMPREKLTQEVIQAVEKRFSKKLNDNIALLLKLEEINTALDGLACCMCQKLANAVFDVNTFDGYCDGCLTSGADDPSFIKITTTDRSQMAQLLSSKLFLAVKRVNFSDLTLEMMDMIGDKSITDVRALQSFGKELLQLGQGRPKVTYEMLPDKFYCPGCRKAIMKSTCSMRILPCKTLHAICDICAQSKAGEPSITCPLDKMIYKTRAEDLARLGNPVVQAPSQVQANQGNPAQYQQGFNPGAAQTQAVMPGQLPYSGAQGVFPGNPAMPGGLPGAYGQGNGNPQYDMPPELMAINPSMQRINFGQQKMGLPQAQLGAVGMPQPSAYGGIPQQPAYGGVPQQPGYQQSGFGGMPQQPAYGGIPQQHPYQQSGFGGMPQQPAYGGVPQQPPYQVSEFGGGMRQQPVYGGVPQQPAYGGMPPQSGYGGLPKPVGQQPSGNFFETPQSASIARPHPNSPSIPKVPGTPLPPVNLPDRTQYLNRFPSVLPLLGTSIAQMDGNNKGWHVNVTKNQVEAVTMTAFDSCAIIGLGLANPIGPGVVAILDSVTIYNGGQAIGQPIFTYNGHEQLIGGNQVISYVTFRTAYQMPPFQKVTMKVKITAPPGPLSAQGIDLYRGNPFERPEVWCGSDELTWEFEETPRVGEGEFVNGQNNLSGPILRIIYQRT